MARGIQALSQTLLSASRANGAAKLSTEDDTNLGRFFASDRKPGDFRQFRLRTKLGHALAASMSSDLVGRPPQFDTFADLRVFRASCAHIFGAGSKSASPVRHNPLRGLS